MLGSDVDIVSVASDLFQRLFALVREPRPTGLDYYQSAARLNAEVWDDADLVTFEVVLVHEPISAEAAVEQDRLVIEVAATCIEVGSVAAEPRSYELSDGDQVVAAARAFIEKHWAQ